MKKIGRHSGAGRNPAGLPNVLFGSVFAAQGNIPTNWIPACAGMTITEVAA